MEHASSQWLLESPSGVKLYDTVILAAPLTNSLPITPKPEVVPVRYVHLHVTLLTTTAPHPNSTYFARDPSPPNAILTTYEAVRDGESREEPEFNSLSYHGRIAPEKDEWVVKIFSKTKPSRQYLDEVFNNRVGWVYYKEVMYLQLGKENELTFLSGTHTQCSSRR